ncbi:MAG TPA: hypothetical protein VMX13_17615 [Sedimentisphaerales bacterium]|nr:hypothetical protein [Sedimentisphaerales bacterium]
MAIKSRKTRLPRSIYKNKNRWWWKVKLPGEENISILFFYLCLDVYSRRSGRLGLVITQTVFLTTAGDKFRRFVLPGGIPINVSKVHHWVAVQPFRTKAGISDHELKRIRGILRAHRCHNQKQTNK